MVGNKKVFVSYLDDNNDKKEGFFLLKKKTTSFCEFESDKNIITIPTSRILKIKEAK